MMPHLKRFSFLYISIHLTFNCCAQTTHLPDSVIIAAGPQYKRSILHQLLWGSNRRLEWVTPIRVPVVLLDTLRGGLTPYKRGGGNESKTLRLISATGKEYVLRSIDKSREEVIPPLVKHTFIASIIRDGVSMSHPYGAFAVPYMLQQAGIPHPIPMLMYIPEQAKLDTFNAVFANDLYLFEEALSGEWSDAAHLGNFKQIISTEDLQKKLEKNQGYKADEQAYIKARLFDILIADWDRNHDNWKWGVDTLRRVYIPIPRDRDQAFFTRDGILNKIMMKAARVNFMQNFTHDAKKIDLLTRQDRQLDLYFTSDLMLDDYLLAANQLQQTLTDVVIRESVKQLPPEIFAVSGTELIEKLISRRNSLPVYAAQFYKILAK